MNHEKNRVRLRVWGDLACFTRPEMKVERVSYDVMTPSAARGILEAVYWKPQIRWVVERIHVLKPVRFTNVRRNELGGVGPAERTLKSYMAGENSGVLAQVIEDDRQQRAATVLRDVDYLIEAHFDLLDASELVEKHYNMFKRRASKGQCFHHPYLGCREFVAHFDWSEGPPPEPDPSLRGHRELGYMLHDIDFADGMTPRFFRAELNDGVVQVPPFFSEEVKS